MRRTRTAIALSLAAAALLATEGKADEAAKAFAAIAADSSGGYRTLARLRVASNLAASGKRSEPVRAQ